MADLKPARGMQVLTADGELIGTVENGSPEGLVIKRLGSAEGELQTIPHDWVDSVDRQVRLNRTGGEAAAGLKAKAFEREAHPGRGKQDGRTGFRIGPAIWLILVLVVIAIALLILMR
ncbi:DUF2171 domain-containing protein [Sphingomonas cavernae]|uniref:DUF2171 domain-containing protein n=1 Tax=Sphingomonas cavernae TaxID=2320861 RepID=A0A418W755_9SPHN|nr:DUF2171 domain-containing protein [Sphingomonas cavernae]RJF85861.1 DUF2171 domain-containing protein [Sphingomonas cavernae]